MVKTHYTCRQLCVSQRISISIAASLSEMGKEDIELR
jgi:hypothetical protein